MSSATQTKRLASGVEYLTRLTNWVTRHENLMSALALLLFVLFFFSWPLFNFRDFHYSSADITQAFTLLRIKPISTLGNPLLSDPVVNMQPWMMFNIDSLRNGQLPLWNPYNANGLPHLANYQSAVFSLFSVPFYLLGMKLGLIISPMLIVYLSGLFCLAFLKRLGLRQWSALVGGTAYAFSGYTILWLGWIDVPASSLVLPCGLYFVERLMQDNEAGEGWRGSHVFIALVGVTISLTVALLGGHPETFFAGLLVVAAFAAYRLIGLALDNRHDRTRLASLSRLGVQLMIAGLLALGIAAVQILPFAEYLLNSGVLQHRNLYYLLSSVLALFFFPNLLGTPSGYYRATLGLPFYNYNEANSLYIGAFIAFLALLSLILVRRSRYVRFFVVIGIVWFLYIFNIMGIGDALRLIPGMSLLPPIRSHIIWLFSLSTCAALFLDAALSGQITGRTRRWLLWAIVIAGMLFMTLGAVLASQLIRSLADQLMKDASGFFQYVPPHIIAVLLTFGIGLLALVMIITSQERRSRTIASGIILLVTFWQGGYQFKTHLPIMSDSVYYPVSPAIRDIQRVVGSSTLVVLGDNDIPAHVNMAYKLAILTSYDALWVQNHDRLFNHLFNRTDNPMGVPRNVYKASPLGLKLFGVEYVVALSPWLDIGSAMGDLQKQTNKTYTVGELLPGRLITQTFTATQNGLRQVMVVPATYGRDNQCTLFISLQSISHAESIAERNTPCQQVKDRQPIVLSFAPVPDSRNQGYQITIRSDDGASGNAITVLAKAGLNYAQGVLSASDQPLQGHLWFDFDYDRADGFDTISQTDAYTLYRFKGSLSSYFSVGNGVAAATDEQAWKMMFDATFDPGQSVILSGNTTPLVGSESAAVQVIAEQPTSIRLRVSRSTPGYLVMAKTFYPGWKATVNGVVQPVLRANYAFSAIRLNAGENTVVYYYDPDSLRYGLIVTAGSLLICAMLVALWLIVRWRDKRNSTSSHAGV